MAVSVVAPSAVTLLASNNKFAMPRKSHKQRLLRVVELLCVETMMANDIIDDNDFDFWLTCF